MKKDGFEELVVVKRSGQRVNFNSLKIAVAIKNAFDVVYESYDEKNVNNVYEEVLKYIETTYEERKTINVEDIQDIIETKLKEKKFSDVYSAFHEYREKRAASRKVFTIKAQHKFVKAMERIASDNALKGETDLKPNEILLKYGKTVANEFTKSYIIDNKYLRAHEEGNIFIRDLEDFPLGIISSVHPDFNHYLEMTNSLNNLTAEILNVTDEISGEINIAALDYLLASWLTRQYKYYYKENIVNYAKVLGFDKYLNVKKCLELIDKETEIVDKIYDFSQFIYSEPAERIFKNAYSDTLTKLEDILAWKISKLFLNLNNSPANNQKLSISFGTNHSLAGNLINHAILNVIESSPPFQNLILIFKVKKSIYENYLETVTDLIIKGHNLVVTFMDSSFNKDSENETEYFASGTRIFENSGSNFKISKGRMIVGETFINMSRLGLKHESSNLKNFYQELDELLELVKNELLLVFETIGNKTSDNYKTLFKDNILDDEKLENSGRIRKVIKNGNLNIGIVGLKECVMALAKDETKEYSLATDILNYLNKKCQAFAHETKLNFYLYEPYNISARRSLMALDKAIYGEIKGITDKHYYDLISNLKTVKDDYKRLGSIQKLLPGGAMINISLAKNITTRRLNEIINELIKADVGFVKFNIGGKGG